MAIQKTKEQKDIDLAKKELGKFVEAEESVDKPVESVDKPVEKEELSKLSLPESDETVEVKKSDLETILSKIEKQNSDIELLMKAADKSRLAKLQSANPNDLVRKYKVSKWKDTELFVIGWKLTSNRCEIIMGKWIEEQTARVVLSDGTYRDVSLLEFYRSMVIKVAGEVIKTAVEEIPGKENVTLFTLQFENGRELEINSVYVN